jgi:hypothetical protein
MPELPYVPPTVEFSDSDHVSIIRESLTRAIVTRRDILLKPKPSYNIDGQEFKWNEYLEVLNKTITQLQSDLQSITEPFELDSVMYT